jgi:hypothetical protein
MPLFELFGLCRSSNIRRLPRIDVIAHARIIDIVDANSVELSQHGLNHSFILFFMNSGAVTNGEHAKNNARRVKCLPSTDVIAGTREWNVIDALIMYIDAHTRMK